MGAPCHAHQLQADLLPGAHWFRDVGARADAIRQARVRPLRERAAHDHPRGVRRCVQAFGYLRVVRGDADRGLADHHLDVHAHAVPRDCPPGRGGVEEGDGVPEGPQSQLGRVRLHLHRRPHPRGDARAALPSLRGPSGGGLDHDGETRAAPGGASAGHPCRLPPGWAGLRDPRAPHCHVRLRRQRGHHLQHPLRPGGHGLLHRLRGRQVLGPPQVVQVRQDPDHPTDHLLRWAREWGDGCAGDLEPRRDQAGDRAEQHEEGRGREPACQGDGEGYRQGALNDLVGVDIRRPALHHLRHLPHGLVHGRNARALYNAGREPRLRNAPVRDLLNPQRQPLRHRGNPSPRRHPPRAPVRVPGERARRSRGAGHRVRQESRDDRRRHERGPPERALHPRVRGVYVHGRACVC
mmetsp:Transcript_39388/g.93249  ORF Transcript_39388/g.93249 Transcript_39388/m.93249 type:complete len:408 (-) Transcript_39388:10523-11746(-)